MLRPPAPRVISALAAVLLAASSVGASLAPRTPSAVRCCQQEKRCQHERARTVAPCCCAPGEAPAAGTTVPQVKAPTASAWAAVIAPTVSLAAPGRTSVRPGRALPGALLVEEHHATLSTHPLHRDGHRGPRLPARARRGAAGEWAASARRRGRLRARP